MQLIGSLVFHVGTAPKYLELFQGDLAQMPSHEDEDVLVVSAFPGDYAPTATSLIGALHRSGISVEKLAGRPAYDLRQYWSSWLSHDVPAGHGFRKVLCFEPHDLTGTERNVDAIFRALGPFIGMRDGVRKISLPVVGTGDRGHALSDVLPPLLEAAYDALSTTSLERIRLVERSESRVEEIRTVFAEFKAARLGDRGPHGPLPSAYDVFISYSQRNADDAEFVHETLERLAPGIRIFQDRRRLREGHDYRTQLDLAVRTSRRMATLYTPEYLRSDACKDEFNTAWALQSSGAPSLLFPMFVRSQGIDGGQIGADLDGDARRKTMQYANCLEADRRLISEACERLIRSLPDS